jgi:hypothetical protein
MLAAVGPVSDLSVRCEASPPLAVAISVTSVVLVFVNTCCCLRCCPNNSRPEHGCNIIHFNSLLSSHLTTFMEQSSQSLSSQ